MVWDSFWANFTSSSGHPGQTFKIVKIALQEVCLKTCWNFPNSLQRREGERIFSFFCFASFLGILLNSSEKLSKICQNFFNVLPHFFASKQTTVSRVTLAHAFLCEIWQTDFLHFSTWACLCYYLCHRRRKFASCFFTLVNNYAGK
jgi:hypothetical protein